MYFVVTIFTIIEKLNYYLLKYIFNSIKDWISNKKL